MLPKHGVKGKGNLNTIGSCCPGSRAICSDGSVYALLTVVKGDGTSSTFTTVDTDTNTITSVKGSAESSYRTGSVNLTPANIGAVSISGDTMTGVLIGQANASYTTAQFRNITMSTVAASGGSNGQIHFQYT